MGLSFDKSIPLDHSLLGETGCANGVHIAGLGQATVM